MRPGGFTLIEVLVVLAILGAAVGLVVSRGAWHSDTLDVRAAADQVALALRATRARAFRLDQPAALRIDASRGFVSGAAGVDARLPRGVTVTPERGPAVFTFQPDGSCSSGAVRFTEGRATRLVSVDFLSGRVTVTP